MRDATGPAAAAAVALLAVYFAGLVFVVQHVAERYTPALYPIVVKRVGGGWLLALSIIVLASTGLVLVPLTPLVNALALGVLLIGLATALLGTYRTWQRCASGETVIGLLQQLDGEAGRSPSRSIVECPGEV